MRFPRGPVQGPAPQWSAVDQAVGKEEYLEAKKQADAILQRGTPEDRQKTMLVYGRILLGLGQTDQARQYLNMLSKSGAAVSAKAAIYGAWLKALDKKPDEAIKTLEKMLQQAVVRRTRPPPRPPTCWPCSTWPAVNRKARRRPWTSG